MRIFFIRKYALYYADFSQYIIYRIIAKFIWIMVVWVSYFVIKLIILATISFSITVICTFHLIGCKLKINDNVSTAVERCNCPIMIKDAYRKLCFRKKAGNRKNRKASNAG